MSSFDSVFFTDLGVGEILLRLIIASVLGGIIGIEREYLARPAGMRTHTLVALAAATFAVVTLEMMAASERAGHAPGDPIRVIEAVTAGVAFLAAGTIILARGRVHGLTTGASLWLAGAIGAAAGLGVHVVAVATAAIAIFVLVVLRWVEAHIPQKPGAHPPADHPKHKE